MKSRPKRDPVRMGTLLPQVLAELGHEGAAATVRLAARWEELVGPELAAQAWPQALRGGVLEVQVRSSVWAQQLQLRRRELLASLASALGDDAPTDLRFRVG